VAAPAPASAYTSRKILVIWKTAVLLDVRRRAAEASEKVERHGGRRHMDGSGENQFGGSPSESGPVRTG
jgi:hypothetical protein